MKSNVLEDNLIKRNSVLWRMSFKTSLVLSDNRALNLVGRVIKVTSSKRFVWSATHISPQPASDDSLVATRPYTVLYVPSITPFAEGAFVDGPYLSAKQAAAGLDRDYYYADGSYDIYSGGSRSWRNHNPGNVVAGTGSIGHDNASNPGGSQAIFASLAAGQAAQTAVLERHRYQVLSIHAALQLYTHGTAPVTDPTALQNYIDSFVAAANSADPAHMVTENSLLSSLTALQLASAIAAQVQLEGYNPGTITHHASGNPIDYNITHNSDGTWTVDNVRGSTPDKSDILGSDISKIEFANGVTYNLAPNSILDQTDFSFVIDTTGSMAPYIDGVQDDADALINAIFGNGQTDAHISVVSFKDPQAGYPDQVVLPFTTETNLADRQQAAIDAIDSLSADGGGDIPEGDYSGLLLALNGSAGQWRDSAAIRHIVLFTDAPVKDTDLQATVDEYAANLGVTIESHSAVAVAGKGQVDTFAFSSSTSGARPFNVQIYTIQVGDDPTATASVQQIATDTGGEFFQSPTPADLVATLTQIIAEIQISGTVAEQATNDVAPIKPFADASVVDPTPGQIETVTIVPSSASNGIFANLGGGTVDPSTGIYTITGTSSDVTNVLEGLVFTPTAHQVAPGEMVTTGFTITDTNTAGTTATDTVTTVVVTDTAPCFVSGTRILTAGGEIAVENLAIGDVVLIHGGAPKPICWIGRRTVDCSRYSAPQDVWPVRVTAGAFGQNKPARDLLLSPDHAVFHDGILIPIRYLINDATIAQERRHEVTYWHVELETHAIISAEGLACETYLDNGNRHAFSNSNGATQLHPDFSMREGCQAIWEARACAPMRIASSAVSKLSKRINRRAKELGHAVPRRPARKIMGENATTVSLSALLHPAWYLAHHADVASAGLDATIHYAHWGWQEGRQPCPESDLVRSLGLVDPGSLMFTMADVVLAGADPVEHFCGFGWHEGRNPNPYFDTKWYLAHYTVPSGMNPLLHYVLLGERQGYAPGPHFDPAWYRQRYQLDIPVCGLAHYLLNRRSGLFSPLSSFNVQTYCREQATMMVPSRDPYAHYLAFGRLNPGIHAGGDLMAA